VANSPPFASGGHPTRTDFSDVAARSEWRGARNDALAWSFRHRCGRGRRATETSLRVATRDERTHSARSCVSSRARSSGCKRLGRRPAASRARTSPACPSPSASAVKWLRKRDLVRDADEEPFREPDETDALDGCTQGALGIGELGRIDDDGEDPPDEIDALPQPKPGRRSRYVGEAAGYHLHAGVAVPAHNTLGRELLFRYCARPPFALERLSLLPDGRVAYRIKKPWRPGQTHRLMTPLEFMARLAALVPPPRFPLVRFHGVFAPHSKQRALVVPGEAPAGPERERSGLARVHDGHGEGNATRHVTPSGTSEQRPAAKGSAARGGAAAATDTDDEKSSRIDWATLLRRVYDIDVLACPCGGRLEMLELVTDKVEIRAALDRLRLDDEPPEYRDKMGEPRIRGP
jgi:hypothetical protein